MVQVEGGEKCCNKGRITGDFTARSSAVSTDGRGAVVITDQDCEIYIYRLCFVERETLTQREAEVERLTKRGRETHTEGERDKSRERERDNGSGVRD